MMFEKSQTDRINKSVSYAIDFLEVTTSQLFISGWIFGKKVPIHDLALKIVIDGKPIYVAVNKDIERKDVEAVYNIPGAMNSGFCGTYLIINTEIAEIHLDFYLGKVRMSIFIAQVNLTVQKNGLHPDVWKMGHTTEPEETFSKWRAKNLSDVCYISDSVLATPIDIILPVFNDYSFLPNLFQSFKKTKMSYRLIVIDDASTDVQTSCWLEEQKQNSKSMILLKNEIRGGFVHAANQGFALASHDVVLLRADIGLPEKWLERLMFPIIMHSDIATSSPFSNRGAISGIPELESLFGQSDTLDLCTIDNYVQKTSPVFTEIPFGDGHCMGIRYNALKQIGCFLTDPHISKAQAIREWCQRAFSNCWKNVQIENLFVLQRSTECNAIEITDNKPSQIINYDLIILKYRLLDPLKYYRYHTVMQVLGEQVKTHVHLVFTNTWGGGAESYLKEKEEKWLSNHEVVICVKYGVQNQKYFFHVRYLNIDIDFGLDCFANLIEVLDCIRPSSILINELASYPYIQDVFSEILHFQKKFCVPLTFLLHDYYAICPTINLMNRNAEYCACNFANCENCISGNPFNTYAGIQAVSDWRDMFELFLRACDEVIVFSKSSEIIIKSVFSSIKNVQLRPHRLIEMPKIDREHKSSNTVNIGLLGTLTQAKGLNIIKELLPLIHGSDIRIVLIGESKEAIIDLHFFKTGKYTLQELPELVRKNDIDVIFIASICPETFSYTSAEAVLMGVPLASFAIGAQAEHVSRSINGLIIPEITSQSVYNHLIPFAREIAFNKL